jgi:predicted nucleic acid-binding protein
VVSVHWVLEQDHAAAVSALLTADRRRLSLVDCCSFQVMRRLGVRRALAFDQHFAEHGFELVHP